MPCNLPIQESQVLEIKSPKFYKDDFLFIPDIDKWQGQKIAFCPLYFKEKIKDNVQVVIAPGDNYSIIKGICELEYIQPPSMEKLLSFLINLHPILKPTVEYLIDNIYEAEIGWKNKTGYEFSGSNYDFTVPITVKLIGSADIEFKHDNLKPFPWDEYIEFLLISSNL